MDTLRTIWSFPLFSFGDGTAVLVSQLVLVALVLLVGYVGSSLVARIIRRRLAQTEMRHDAAHILQRISYYGLLIAVGVGCGSRNIINNFFSGRILLIKRPVRVSDFVEAG